MYPDGGRRPALPEGMFRQYLNEDGWQQETYPEKPMSSK
jgi:glucan phosphorylase